MTIKEQRDIKVEVKKIYVANDGTEFEDVNECKKYEQTAWSAINEMFKKLNVQKTYIDDGNPLGYFEVDESIYAVKIENTNQVEVINKWLKAQNDCHINESYLGADAVGTIQLLDPFEGGVWVIGTPDKLKEMYNKAIDNLFDKLVEKPEVEVIESEIQ